jgi:GlpG protein
VPRQSQFKDSLVKPIGSIEGEGYGKVFSDFLYSQGIENQVEETGDGRWLVWVIEEEKLDSARGYLVQFRANPRAEKFASSAFAAAEKRQLEAGAAAARDVKVYKVKAPAVFSGVSFRMWSLSTSLIAACVLVAIGTQLGNDVRMVSWLSMTGYEVANNEPLWKHGFPEIFAGQVWRLITPIFLHFSVLHILFNMLWLRDLGSLIEARAGTLKLGLLVVTIGIASNLGQYLVAGPNFGGMSGVVYGLLGYVWMRGKFDPSSGMFVTQQTIMIMVGWFVLCLTGMMGPIANAAHGVGLVMGMAIGYLSALRPVGFKRGR